MSSYEPGLYISIWYLCISYMVLRDSSLRFSHYLLYKFKLKFKFIDDIETILLMSKDIIRHGVKYGSILSDHLH